MARASILVDFKDESTKAQSELGSFHIRSLCARYGNSKRKSSSSGSDSPKLEDEEGDDLPLLHTKPSRNRPRRVRRPAITRLNPPRRLAPVYSDLLQRSYDGKHLDEINDAIEYFMNVAGPVYVWKLDTTEAERRTYQDSAVRLFLGSPTYTEAILAWLFYVRTDSITKGETSNTVFYQQQRSLSLLRKLLSRPEENADAITWTSICFLVLNHERGDWDVYDIHVRGLRSFIAAIGGDEALEKRSLRAYNFSQWLTHLNPNDKDFETTPSPQLDELSPVDVPCLDMHSAFTKGLAVLTKCYLWTHHNLDPTESESVPHEKLKIEASLWKIAMSNQIPMSNDRLLCIGVLIRLGSMPLFESSGGPDGMTHSSLTKLCDVLQNSIDTISEHCRWDYVLWTCLVVLVMGTNVALVFKQRIALCKALLSEDILCLEWRNVRPMLNDVYLDQDMERVCRTSWESILRPAVT